MHLASRFLSPTAPPTSHLPPNTFRKMDFPKIAVLGAGTMGSGIVTVALMAGRQVVMVDIADAALAKGRSAIEKNLEKAREKGRLTEEIPAILARLTTATDYAAIGDCSLVIEAVSENPVVKGKVFELISKNAGDDAVIVSNTSALKISAFAEKYKKPERVLGMHFFNPPVVLKLVELVQTPKCDPAVFAKARAFVESIGKEPVVVKESPGFIVNRILIPVINEAACIFGEGVASAADIDTAMKSGAAHPIGPLALGDLVGLDVCLAIMQTLQEIDPVKFKPAPALEALVKAGKLGRKSGEGFFSYAK